MVPINTKMSTFRLRLLVTLIGFTGCVFAVEVTVKHSHLNATEGGNVTLLCTFTTTLENLSDLTIAWTFLRSLPKAQFQMYYYGDKLTYINKEFNGRLLATHTPGNASITIEKLRPSDSGNYLCQVDNPPDFTGNHIGSVVLTVLVAPSKPTCGIKPHPVKTDSAILSCHSDEGVPVPTYHWVEIVNHVPENIFGHSGRTSGLLTISNISAHEYGVYQCTASNSLGNQSCTFDLSTLYAETDHIIGAIIGAVLAAIVIGAIVWVVARKAKKNAKKNVEKDTELQVKQEAMKPSNAYVTVPTDDAAAASTEPNDAKLAEVGPSSMETTEVHRPAAETPLLSKNAAPSGTENTAKEEIEGEGSHAT
ncbi:V-set and immunoglobulin domain-containing protein 1-like isoform X2 [Scyliorhinus canicula]|uniref:V-set and immunoglobulin domain-containing protein 1-like isoform X2 n=1 Tax=Scyliorhinus canicula TaxID=7830 RepID=UPI0018F6D94D|nr:V-set and immunoglobulin domain-containing protein 1-like isoform X2 [Scyliorhinus canicula]